MDLSAEKRKQYERCMEAGPVTVFLVPGEPGVQVPSQFRNDRTLTLNTHFPNGALDLVVSDWGISETLHFKDGWHQVRVPWSAIYVIAEHDTHAARFVDSTAIIGIEEAASAVECQPELQPETEAEAVGDSPKSPTTPIRRGHLRLLN